MSPCAGSSTEACGGNEKQCDPGGGVFSFQREKVKDEFGSVAGNFTMSYPKWCALLVSMILASRTSFAAFLKYTIHLIRSSPLCTASTPTFFPVPLLSLGQFDRMPSTLSSGRRKLCHLRRAIHCICMALNFWQSGGKWPCEESLRRNPNAEHQALYKRLASLIRSDGLAESFSLTKSGRKHTELVARLSELSSLLTAHGGGAECGYERGFSGVSVPVDLSKAPELVPYADLQADRLQLHGTGHWDVTNLLPDSMVMAYREPRSLLASLPLGAHPKCRDAEPEVAKLAYKWDQKGLLRLYDSSRPVGSLVKVFNCYKSPEVDRQIGDRRGQNSYECRIEGPSKDLPSGPDIMGLSLDVRHEKVVVIITDRKDYYHQIWSTDARAMTNAVGPSVHKELLKNTKAYEAYSLRSAMRKKIGRERRGDDLHSFSLHPGENPTSETLPPDHLWVSFGSVLQGDHAGVEIATAAHECWLEEFGLLQKPDRLVASHSLRSTSHLQGLVIDDYFAASVEKREKPNSESVAAHCYTVSQRAYTSADLLGSPAKDVVCANEGKLVGAFVNSGPAALSRGLCTVGSPAMKRVALSFITLALCKLAYTTDVLHLCLIGGWVSILAYRRPLMSILARSYHLVDQNNLDHNAPKLPQSWCC
eukprot:s3587_g10.t1